MRILMLTQFYPPFIGGEAIHVQALSGELVARGHEVAVVTLWHQGLASFECDRGVRVYRVHSSLRRIPWLFSNRSRRRAAPFPDPEIMVALRDIIVHERPEIVHAHNWLVHSFLPLKAWSGARLVVTLHNYNLVCANTALLYHGTHCDGPGFIKCIRCSAHFYGVAKGVPVALSNRVMGSIERSLVDMFLAVSEAAATGNGFMEGQHTSFRVIPNFMPDDIFVSQEGQENVDSYLSQLPEREYLLFVGSLNFQKGLDVLLRAYSHLTNPPALVLIGYPTPDWTLLRDMCPAGVVVLTDWPRHAVIQAWRRSLIALAPSIGPETFGMAVMEAMWAGRPVIASRIGGLVDLVVDGETGLLVEPGDAVALQRAIEQLLLNPDLCSRMGQAASRKVTEFQANAVVPRIECVYEELLQRVKPSQESSFSNGDIAIGEV